MSLTKNPSYVLGDIILSKKEPFTFEEIFNELHEAGVHKSSDDVKKAIQRLKDNGIIVQWGTLYSVYR